MRYKGPGSCPTLLVVLSWSLFFCNNGKPFESLVSLGCRLMADFVQQRHKGRSSLQRPRELIVACPPMRSNVNLSRIVRAAGCCGVRRVVCCGTAKLISKIARDTGDEVKLELHRTLLPVLKQLRDEGFELVGLEQTSNSDSLYEFSFKRRTVLVIGNERLGIQNDVLKILDYTVEIPIYGPPDSHNAATATAIGLYEFCRQYPNG